MSRIGVRPITIPAGVEVTVEIITIKVKGPRAVPATVENLTVEIEENLTVKRPPDSAG